MHTSIARASFALILAATFAASYVGMAAPARADQSDPGALPSYAIQAPGAQPPGAQPPGVQAPDAQPPDMQAPDMQAPDTQAPPAVARLSVVEGQVALKHGDDSDQAAAAANAPIVAGDYITTGNDGRAEVQLDGANVVRAGAGTELRFTQLDGANDVTQLAQGTVELRVFATGQDNVQVQTPSVDLEPSQAGEYLISVTSDGNTQVTARSGSIAVVTPQGTQQVEPGRTMVVAGEAANPRYQYTDEVAQTDVEAWGDQRDQMLASAQNAQSQYVPSDMTGSADLNQYGNWVAIPGYGNAWVPNGVAPGWSPYSNGSWVSLNYYGPTWVAAEPWGWAPYHYGRWFYAPTVGWAWTPGARNAVWSPALVAFFGFGGGGRVGIGFGNVGWVPLAPGESYRPWWGRGGSLSLGVSFASYRNYSHGFVGVSYNAWQHGVINRAHPMSVGELQGAHFYRGNVATSRFATNAPRPQYQRFNAIGSNTSTWQRFGQTGQAASRSQGYGAASGGWQRFNGGGAQRSSGYQSSQQPRQYGPYQQERQYGSYQQPQRQYGSYQQPQRQYQSYPQQRQYGGYQGQRQYQSYPQQRQYQSYPQQRQYGGYQGQGRYQSYPGQRQYAAPQRQYQSYRPQQSSRSAPSHTSNSGGRPRGPGRP
jgi:hypothetical protein